MTTRRIKLTCERTNLPGYNVDGFRIRITASDGVNIDDKLFRYRDVPLDPSTDPVTLVGNFDGICSPDDLDNLPEDAATGTPPWFRLDYVDLYLRAEATADDIWTAVQEDVGLLRKSLIREETYNAALAIDISSNFHHSFSADGAIDETSEGSIGADVEVTRAIKLTFDPLTESNDGYRVRCVASDAVAMSDKVFRYVRKPKNPNDVSANDEFNGVCSPADLVDFTISAPLSYLDPQFFRLNSLDIIVGTREAAETFIQDLTNEVEQLKFSLDKFDNFDAMYIVWIGGAP
jgi:hypothetical protein